MGEGKGQKRNVFLIIGALVVIVALTADKLGIGSAPGFGWKQGALLVLGLGIAVMGMKCCKCAPKESPDSGGEKSHTEASNQV